jgi:hypothetical protein
MKILQCSHITATVDSGGERKEEGKRGGVGGVCNALYRTVLLYKAL